MSVQKKIKYAYFVESVSRKFTLVKNKCSKNNTYGTFTAEPARYMGGGVRRNSRFGYGLEEKNYMFLRFNPRTSAFDTGELEHQQNFGVAAKLRKAWKANLATAAAMASAWKDPSNGTANGIAKQGYTANGWFFAVALSVVQGGGDESSPWPTYVPA